MDDNIDRQERDDDAPSPDEKGEARKEKTPHTRMSRKRTKTGCLTCRRRRIKCGEERPTCANCIKSKRQCEGYNQRVIFKDPMNIFRGPSSMTAHSFAATQIQRQSEPTTFSQFIPLDAQGHLPNIRPKPEQGFQIQDPSKVPTSIRPEKANQMIGQQPYIVFVPPTTKSDFPAKSIAPALPQDMSTAARPPFPKNLSHNFTPEPLHRQRLSWAGASDQNIPHETAHSGTSEAPVPKSSHTAQSSTYGQPYTVQYDVALPQYPLNYKEQDPGGPTEFQALGAPSSPGPTIPQETYWQVPSETMPESNQVPPAIDSAGRLNQWQIMDQPQESHLGQKDLPDMVLAEGYLVDGKYFMPIAPDDNDELFDVSDDDIDMDDYEDGPDMNLGPTNHRRLMSNDLGMVMAVQAAHDGEDRRIRTYHSLIDHYGPNMLVNYHPSARNSPLSDPVAAQIFSHFINVIAPSLSMYERHPANPSILLQGLPVPRSQQHIWSYTMPALALANHALLHAMLAMASLHIAKLQNTPIEPSLKHYHMSIRRLAKNVGLPTKRGQIATLATTLLLGYYEVMSADHKKWCDHLLGATQLIKQIDFAGMTRYLKSRKGQSQPPRPENLYHHRLVLGAPRELYNEPVEDQDLAEEVDENIVGILMGQKLRYAEYGQVFEDAGSAKVQEKKYTQRALDMFNTQRDLFWWFAKQDAFQSILSQNRLFLNYDRWGDCPPRAPIGRRDAVLGTFDHVILLLARLAEFAAKDLKRKKKAMQAGGVQFKPPPGMQMPGHAPGASFGSKQGPASFSSTPSNGADPPQGSQMPMMSEIPPFAGMLPNTGKASLPRGFTPAKEDSPPRDEDDDGRLEDQTGKALGEWLEIRSAFDMIAQQFGPDFEPLGPEFVQEVESPFGPAIQYRTYSIACIWLVYYMGLIICHRAHPSMPPMAMAAAGIAARQTAAFANNIGRICAAMAPDSSLATHVNLGAGAGLSDSAFSLFVAGIQLQDHRQRVWIIQRMIDIERLTGWATASQVAKGCETSWTRAAEMGRGPPYTLFSQPPPIATIIWNRADRRIYDMRAEKGEVTSFSRITSVQTGRVQWAEGLIGVEDNLEHLGLDDDDDDDHDHERNKGKGPQNG